MHKSTLGIGKGGSSQTAHNERISIFWPRGPLKTPSLVSTHFKKNTLFFVYIDDEARGTNEIHEKEKPTWNYQSTKWKIRAFNSERLHFKWVQTAKGKRKEKKGQDASKQTCLSRQFLLCISISRWTSEYGFCFFHFFCLSLLSFFLPNSLFPRLQTKQGHTPAHEKPKAKRI